MKETQINGQNSHADYKPATLTIDKALDNIYAALDPIADSEHVKIKESLGRVLATDIIAPLNVPLANNSAMDGYALNNSDIRQGGDNKIKVTGTALAGKPYSGTVGTGECVRIMTGAVMPAGTDTVIIQEDVEHAGGAIIFNSEINKGENVRLAGEDIAAGDVLLHRGRRITPADMGLMASSGIGEIELIRKPRIAFFSTGDELRSIGEELIEGHVYDSNRYTLFGMLSELNVFTIDLGIVNDDRKQLQKALEDASTEADLIITSGGVSVGDADFIMEILRNIGTVNFWKIAIKPGRPLAFGKIGNACFFGLPGNPVSVMVTFHQFVKPAIRYLSAGEYTVAMTMRIPCISRLRKKPGRVEYQRGILEQDANSRWVVKKTGAQGSGILRSMSQANCFIILPMDSNAIEPGDLVEVQPF